MAHLGFDQPARATALSGAGAAPAPPPRPRRAARAPAAAARPPRASAAREDGPRAAPDALAALRRRAAGAAAGLAAAAALALAPPTLPAALAAAAPAADGAAVGACVLSKCQGALAKCLGDLTCAENLVCLQACNGAPDETACQVKCGDKYDDAAIGVRLLLGRWCGVGRLGGGKGFMWIYMHDLYARFIYKFRAQLLRRPTHHLPTRPRHTHTPQPRRSSTSA
jgi:hypothetical protein